MTLYPLYREVCEQYSYIQQARKIKLLEDISQRHYKGKRLNYEQMLQHAYNILHDLKFQTVSYFDSIVHQLINLTERILNDRYLQKRYIKPPKDQLTPYGQSIRKLYGRLVRLLDDFYAIRNSHQKKAASNKPPN
jgi:hypothetical protein